MNSNKRKDRSNDNDRSRGAKRNKGGSGGKWQTPHQQAKVASVRGTGTIEPGDIGIWATCARGQEGRATVELRSMLHQFAEQFYGTAADADEADDDDEDLDIEASIRKEAAAIENQKSKPQLFTPVHLDIECVLFVKVRPPIDPVDFVHRIGIEVASKPGSARTKYINRLTPMTLMGKATEKGLEDVAKAVLGEYFKLAKKNDSEEVRDSQEDVKQDESSKTDYSVRCYAIRPTIRNHNTLKRDVVINQIASSIADVHKVNLTTPDKVILVEIYQTVCGMSVVGSDWEALKRFNIAELSKPAPGAPKVKLEAAMPERVTSDEALSAPNPELGSK
ncbi:tRNA acetyltransferase TAN1 [Lachnellula suecica]|uniref:tRNA acetyltransferase TAN1 n=1 Tax=Lachnellula suecica TaxID=602035 RepID=A0A8T9CG44_9HELO|nr:tRNA acetyltransferase TAN1 [Lachnellula suecica]